MKSIVKPTFYFSAYPLKAIKDSSAPEKQPSSPYLRALLSGKTTSRPNAKARVFPMVNPYGNNNQASKQKPERFPKDIELTEKDWYKHYE